MYVLEYIIALIKHIGKSASKVKVIPTTRYLSRHGYINNTRTATKAREKAIDYNKEHQLSILQRVSALTQAQGSNNKEGRENEQEKG